MLISHYMSFPKGNFPPHIFQATFGFHDIQDHPAAVLQQQPRHPRLRNVLQQLQRAGRRAATEAAQQLVQRLRGQQIQVLGRGASGVC